MKKISDCKEYFKDVFMDCLEENALKKNKFESTENVRFEMLCETLKYIYGEDFNKIRPTWTQKASNEFYSQQTT